MNKNWFINKLKSQIFVLDGVMGTMLLPQLPPESCVDMANIEHSKLVASIYKKYVNAGADILSTNTFGANRMKLSEFGLGDSLVEINIKAAEMAVKAAADNVLVAGILGPTGKLIKPLGDFSFDYALNIYKEQAESLIKGGVDLFFLETFSDIKEIKAAIIALKETSDIPIMASMTYGEDFKTFTGTDPSTAANILSSLGADVLGVNCSTGPESMLEVVGRYAQSTDIPILVEPNAGMPRIENGKTVFQVSAAQMADYAEKFVQIGANIIGSCCGSTPEFTVELKKRLKNVKPVERHPSSSLKLSSRMKTIEIGKGFPFCIIGERINPTNRDDITESILSNEIGMIQKEAAAQEKEGAHILDLNIGVPDINEAEYIKTAVRGIENVVQIPLSIDNINFEAIEAALKECAGKPLINSVHGSEKSMETIIPLAAKYGAGLLCLAVGEKGIPKTVDQRLEILKRIISRAEKEGINRNNLICDCLTLTVSAQQKGVETTLKALQIVSEELNLPTVLGVSNISFGLPERSLINSTFLSMAMAYGLDAAIINPGDKRLMDTVRAASVLTIRDKNSQKFITSFKKKKKRKKESSLKDDEVSTRNDVYQAVISGNKTDIENLVKRIIDEGVRPLDINNDLLIPAINEVGRLYDNKEVYLPQMILAAETMQKAFSVIEPYFKKDEVESTKKVMLCTVKGDVHDIGKNIVALFLKNHGFKVIDLGKDIATDYIVKKTEELKPDVLGLSALMTTTMIEMPKVIQALKDKDICIKIVVGGAVVTKKYAKGIQADGYAKDGMEAVKIIKEFIDND